MNERTFTIEDQRAFAGLSGDNNPLHVDEVAARRLLFGRPLVHGVHGLIWALDCWLADHDNPVELRSLNANFVGPIGLNEQTRCAVTIRDDGNVDIRITAGGLLATSITLTWILASGAPTVEPLSGSPPSERPRPLEPAEIATASGEVDLMLDMDAMRARFPHLCRALPGIQIAAILATTRVVGVFCPGLHSLYSAVALTFEQDGAKGSPLLTYEIAKWNERFSLAELGVTGPGLKGTLQTFRRPAPRRQAGMGQLTEEVEAGEFAGQRALVVGGSRGLGELTAKLLAAGGAEVTITFVRGSADAQEVVAEITASGAVASAMAFDVLDQGQAIADQFGTTPGAGPTHLYYFATPHIATAAKGVFSPAIFQRFCDFYLTAFLEAVQTLLPLGLRGVLYPSTVFIDKPPENMGEYAASKAAGEILCAFVERTHRGLTILRPRLPKLATDQTLSLTFSGRGSDPVPVLLEQLRRLVADEADS